MNVRRLLACLASLPLVTLASIASAQDAPGKEGPSDHSQVVGHLGVGYFGQFDVPLGNAAVPGGEGAAQPSQIVGVRYWFTDRVGLDVGLGLGFRSGSSSVPAPAGGNTTVDNPSTFVFSP